MTDAEVGALDRLIETVAAGRATYADFRIAPFDRCMSGEYTLAVNANHGDMNAAKSLHDAMIPDLRAVISEVTGRGRWVAWMWDESNARHFEAFADDPARAWLLSILRAYRAHIGGDT